MISRRSLLATSFAFAAGPLLRAAAAPLPREVDVVVIGAGAAGIAAARRIMAAQRSVLLVEAAGRVGGRCESDPTTFGTAVDRGASRLYNPDSNAVVKVARSVGADFQAVPSGQKLRIGRRNARAGEAEDFLVTLVRAHRAIAEAARGRTDVSCAAALPKDLGDWESTVAFVLGASATGADLGALSAIDRARLQERSSAIGSRQGLGQLLVQLGSDIPTALGTPATRIFWGGRDVAVETPAGRIAARAAIVTASSNVLAEKAIQFSPEMPKQQLDAAAGLRLGSYDRIILQLPGNPLGLGRDESLIERSAGTHTALLTANVGGSPLCTVDVAGGFGRDLSAQGEAAMIAFAREWLSGLFGSEALANLGHATATRWNDEPYVRGAMSAARPGAQAARRILAEPFGNIFIAGEATHETLYGTVDGAWESGERAAAAALGRLAPAKPTAKKKPGRKRKS